MLVIVLNSNDGLRYLIQSSHVASKYHHIYFIYYVQCHFRQTHNEYRFRWIQLSKFSKLSRLWRKSLYSSMLYILRCYASSLPHDDVIKWKHFPRYWPFVRGIHRPSVNSPHKGQWRGALVFPLICAWTKGWAIDRDAGDLRRHLAHYTVTVMLPGAYLLSTSYVMCNTILTANYRIMIIHELLSSTLFVFIYATAVNVIAHVRSICSSN